MTYVLHMVYSAIIADFAGIILPPTRDWICIWPEIQSGQTWLRLFEYNLYKATGPVKEQKVNT